VITAELATRWPVLFAPGAPVRPLAIGTHRAILEAWPDIPDKRALSLALHWHCSRWPYVTALMVAGTPRYGLQGEAGAVTEAEAAAVRARWQRGQDELRERQRATLAARAAAEAAAAVAVADMAAN
jgi:sRNA-binding protein